MTRPVSNLRPHSQPRPEPRALSNEPFVSEPFGDFGDREADWAWPTPDAGFPQSDQTDQPAHDDPRGLFVAVDDDDELEDDDLFDDDEDDDLLDDDDEDDDDDFFDDDEDDDFDDDDEDDDEDDDDSYFLGDDD
ncbi:MAG: hypothetical protein AAGF84_11320 [Planctomycetota bacterium]